MWNDFHPVSVHDARLYYHQPDTCKYFQRMFRGGSQWSLCDSGVIDQTYLHLPSLILEFIEEISLLILKEKGKK